MANSALTDVMVTKAAAAVLHQECNLLRRINRQYDAQTIEGRPTGGSLKIRMPNQVTTRRGWVMNSQDITETSETLAFASPFGIDLEFTDSDLSDSITNFTERILRPSLKRLSAEIESYLYGLFADSVSNFVDHDGSAIEFKDLMKGKQKLIENCVPQDESDLSLLLSPGHNTTLVDVFKGLFLQDLSQSQVKSGSMRPVAGVGWVGVSTHATDHTTGTAVKTTTFSTDIAAGEASGTDGSKGIHIDGAATTWKAGDRFTIEGVNAVHPETKADLGYLKQFVVAEDMTPVGNEGDLKFKPISGGDAGIVSSGARQNVSAAPVDGKAIVKLGAAAGETTNRSLYFHRDAMAVCFGNLQNPSKYGAWGSTETIDNISVRVWRDRDIVNAKFPVRLDVYLAGKCIRPEMAAVLHADG